MADLNELHELSGRLESTNDLALQMQHIVDTLARMHGADRGLVSLADETGTRQRLVASLGFSEFAVKLLADVPMGDEDPCGRALAEGQRVIIEDVSERRALRRCSATSRRPRASARCTRRRSSTMPASCSAR